MINKKARLIRIFHLFPGGEKKYHTGPGCLVSNKEGDAYHYVTDNPFGQVDMIRGNFELACSQQTDFIHWPVDKIQTSYEIVPEEEIRQEDYVTFRRRFCQAAA